MKIFIGADHRGIALKNYLIEALQSLEYDVVDCSLPNDPQDDYPDFARDIAHKVASEPDAFGVLICGSGVGVCIAANKVKGCYCAMALNPEQVRVSKAHDGYNAISLAADYTSPQDALQFTTAAIQTPFENTEKRLRRMNKIKQIEQSI